MKLRKVPFPLFRGIVRKVPFPLFRGIVRKVLAFFAIIVLLALAAVYHGFVHNNKEFTAAPADTAQVLHVMAPYEISSHKKTLEAVAEAYSQIEGHKKVEIEFVSPEDYRREIGMRTDKGNTPDLIICENTIMPALVDMGIFRDITSWVTVHRRSIYCRNMWGNTMSDGKYYGVPFTSDPYVLFYNKDFLDGIGHQPPVTWEELADICADCSLGNFGFGFAAKRPEEITSLYMQMLYSMGGTLREVNGENGLQVLDYLSSRKSRKEIPEDTVNWSSVDLAYGFMEGNMAAIAGRLSLASLFETYPPEFTIGVSELPIGKKHAYLFHGENIGITVNADYEEAIKFLAYLSTSDTAGRIAEGLDTIPVLLEVPYKKSPVKGLSLDDDYVREFLGNGVSKGSYGSWFGISSSISDEVYRLLEGQWTEFEDIANPMQDKVRTAIIDG